MSCQSYGKEVVKGGPPDGYETYAHKEPKLNTYNIIYVRWYGFGTSRRLDVRAVRIILKFGCRLEQI